MKARIIDSPYSGIPVGDIVEVAERNDLKPIGFEAKCKESAIQLFGGQSFSREGIFFFLPFQLKILNE